MFQNECDGLAKIREALFTRLALAICAGNFRTVGDGPRAVLLDDRGELVARASFYRRRDDAPDPPPQADLVRGRLPPGGSG